VDPPACSIQEKLDLDLKIAEEPDFGAASSGATYESYVWTDRGVKQDGTPVYSEAEESPALMQHVQKGEYQVLSSLYS
jgi:hypothetical protein